MNKRFTAGVVVLAVLVLVLAVMGLTTGYAEKNFAVAYIDSTRVLAQHPDMVKVNESLQARTNALQKELENKAKPLAEADQQKLLAEYQGKLTNERLAQQGEVVKRINVQIRDFAKKLGYTLVLDSRSVIYGGTDITNDFLKSIGAAKSTK